MRLTKKDVHAIVDLYIRAWREQEPSEIVKIFTDSAVYQERAFEEPIKGRERIRDYWQGKVVESQARIECELINLYLDGDTAIAEWQAEFDDIEQGCRKRIREVAILEFRDGLIANLREYWTSELI